MKIKTYIATALTALNLLNSIPAKADSFEVRAGYHHKFEDEIKNTSPYSYNSGSDVPPIELNLEMRLDAKIAENVMFAMRNNFGYVESSRISIEDGMYFNFAENFGILSELHIQGWMIPKVGVFFSREKDYFKSYAGAKVILGENFTGEFVAELSYIPNEKSVMIYFENRTIVNIDGHQSSRQSLKIGYRGEGLLGVGANFESSELGDENVKLGLTAGIFVGAYTK
ncbi:hypothetical protein J4232_01980 [Candidatus Woesearchaeota archaeon]|nr:hypothetical protein [Candidatus Woesearchaeota archaeon]